MPLNIWPFKNKETPQQTAARKITGGGSFGIMDLAALSGSYDGSKVNFLNGFGMTADLRIVDLRLLQFRSLQLFRENAFAITAFKRLETKIINTGLRLRCSPPSELLSDFMTDEELQEWSGNTERLFEVWSKDKRLVDISGQYTFGQVQKLVYNTANLSGDCLVIMSVNSLGLPQIELVDGINVASPGLIGDKIIKQGVELNTSGEEIAYHVLTDTLKTRRVKAKTTRGQRRAWLVKRSGGRVDDVRGLPLLATVMQNINEVGKYMDSEQRAALVNSYLVMTHNVDERAPMSNPLTGAVLDSDTATNTETGDVANFKKMQPGFIGAKLMPNETITSHDTKRPNVNMGPFVEFNIKIMAASMEIPPEIFFLEFKSNFSASRQAKLDFNDFAQKEIQSFSESFTQPLYNEWLTGMVLTGDIVAPGYISALRNIREWPTIGAWRSAIWRGLPNKSVDELKQVKALEIAVDRGWMTNDQVADEYFSTDYADNVRKLKKEREANGINVGGDPVDTGEAIQALSQELNDFMNSFEGKTNA